MAYVRTGPILPRPRCLPRQLAGRNLGATRISTLSIGHKDRTNPEGEFLRSVWRFRAGPQTYRDEPAYTVRRIRMEAGQPEPTSTFPIFSTSSGDEVWGMQHTCDTRVSTCIFDNSEYAKGHQRNEGGHTGASLFPANACGKSSPSRQGNGGSLTHQTTSRSASKGAVAAWLGLAGSIGPILGCLLPAEVVTPTNGGKVAGVKSVAFKTGSYNLYQLLDPPADHVIGE